MFGTDASAPDVGSAIPSSTACSSRASAAGRPSLCLPDLFACGQMALLPVPPPGALACLIYPDLDVRTVKAAMATATAIFLVLGAAGVAVLALGLLGGELLSFLHLG